MNLRRKSGTRKAVVLGGLVHTASAKQMIDQLYVMLGSIKAGNTSSKLRKAVVSLLSVLVEHDILNDFQRRKILRDYIG